MFVKWFLLLFFSVDATSKNEILQVKQRLSSRRRVEAVGEYEISDPEMRAACVADTAGCDNGPDGFTVMNPIGIGDEAGDNNPIDYVDNTVFYKQNDVDRVNLCSQNSLSRGNAVMCDAYVTWRNTEDDENQVPNPLMTIAYDTVGTGQAGDYKGGCSYVGENMGTNYANDGDDDSNSDAPNIVGICFATRTASPTTSAPTSSPTTSAPTSSPTTSAPTSSPTNPTKEAGRYATTIPYFGIVGGILLLGLFVCCCCCLPGGGRRRVVQGNVVSQFPEEVPLTSLKVNPIGSLKYQTK